VLIFLVVEKVFPPEKMFWRAPPPSAHFQLFGGRQYIVKKTSRHQRLNRLTSINVDFVRPTMAMLISFGEFPLKRQPKSVGAS
jgi:hypothetical protein